MNRLIAAVLATTCVIGGVFISPLVVGAGGTTVYTHSERYMPAYEPQRVFDSREGAKLQAGEPITVELPMLPHLVYAADGAIRDFPAPALAVAVNITVVDPVAAGYVTVWAAGQKQPLVSNVNFGAGETEANFAVVPTDRVEGGAIQLVASVDTHLIVDLFGAFDALVVGYVP